MDARLLGGTAPSHQPASLLGRQLCTCAGFHFLFALPLSHSPTVPSPGLSLLPLIWKINTAPPCG